MIIGIYIDGKKIGTVKYKTGEYLKIQIDHDQLPKLASMSGIDINNETMDAIYKEFSNKKNNSFIRGKNIENLIAAAVVNQYIQIGDGLDGKFPVIDLGNMADVISVKSLNQFCKSYKDANGNVDINAVCDRLMTYYNQIDDINITVNDEYVDKTLLVVINGKTGKKKQKTIKAIQKEMDRRIKEKHSDDADEQNNAKCKII